MGAQGELAGHGQSFPIQCRFECVAGEEITARECASSIEPLHVQAIPGATRGVLPACI